jgi:D-cysteine desulfhydrase
MASPDWTRTGHSRFTFTYVHWFTAHFARKAPQTPFRSSKTFLMLQVPKQRYCLGMLPTPIHRFYPPGLPDGVELWIKRDDLTGMQLSGNKV